MGRVLLHICCGPCAIHPWHRLKEAGSEVTGFWYNPNIHPFSEHQRRLEALQTTAQSYELPLIVAERYEMVEFLRTVAGHEDDRCAYCYRMRLSRTAQVARQQGFERFTTTLLVSPHQKHDLIREIGEEIAGEYGIGFYYDNFRTGFSQGRREAKELGIYRQQYCGCVYSEWERYSGMNIAESLGKQSAG